MFLMYIAWSPSNLTRSAADGPQASYSHHRLCRWPAAEQARADLRRALEAGEPVNEEMVDRLILPLVEKAVPEWQAALSQEGLARSQDSTRSVNPWRTPV